jgi:hypothetical protein
MQLDVRLPIGLMFTVLGIILSVWGGISDRAEYQRSLNININFWWGLVLLGFGLIMLLMVWRRTSKRRNR